MSGAEIAAEVAAAIAEAGAAVGDGPLVLTLNKVSQSSSGDFWENNQSKTAYSIVAIEGSRVVRDAADSMIEKTVRTLTIEATGPTIDEGDTVVIGGKKHAITAVRQLAPAGVTILYEVDLSD